MLYILVAIIIGFSVRKICIKLMGICNRKIDICVIRNNLSGCCCNGNGYCKKIVNCRMYDMYKFFYHFCDFLESMITYSLFPALPLYCAYKAYVTKEEFAAIVFSLFTLVFISQMINKLKEYKFDSKNKQKRRIRAGLLGVFLYFMITVFIMSKI